LSELVDEAEVVALVHELAVEFRKVMPKEDKSRTTEATDELRRMSVTELVHELAEEYRKAKKRAEEAKPSAPIS